MKRVLKRKKLLWIVMCAGILAIVLTACTNKKNKDAAGKNPISIVTTTNIYADIAQNIVGKYGKATAIIKDGSVDPHDFDPTTNDAKTADDADIIVANGLGYDSWMNKLADSVDKKPVLVGEDILGFNKGANPHIWYDLKMAPKYVNYLKRKLSKIDSKHTKYYQKQAAKYLRKFAQVEKIVKSITIKNKKTVYVSEPVFDYALVAAGFKVGNKEFEKAIQNGFDPSPQTVQNMSENIKNNKIAFFVNNTQSSSSTINNILKQVKSKKIPVLKVRETIPNKTTYLSWIKQSYQELAQVAER